MAFLNPDMLIDAKRYETIAHATVMASGRLRFATDAAEMMDLEKMNGVLLFKAEPHEVIDVFGLGMELKPKPSYAAVPCMEDDPRAFSLKKSGPYRYLSLKNFFVQNGTDFKTQQVSFEITEVNEEFEGKPVYRLTQYSVPRTTRGDGPNSDLAENGDEDARLALLR